jgi:hypothetical protein
MHHAALGGGPGEVVAYDGKRARTNGKRQPMTAY